MSILKLPEKEGEYLFLFAPPDGDHYFYYKIDNLLFDVDGEAYLECGEISAAIAWFQCMD